MFRQLLHDLLPESPVFNSVIHPSKNSCGIRNTLFFPDLRAGRVQVCNMHPQIVGSRLKCTAGSRACLLKYQRNIFSRKLIMPDPLLLFLFQLRRKINQIKNLLRCKIHQF